ncbi:amidase domain-containing protein [Clostridium sp.]|uniref:amidase domain-containing protein n=1 Tax=Clostridium sp. TaxID=1506 RepID=UPI001A387043|nr:amidase domain-containing protein [Clostridium sp.]MBK5235598.1 amidase domain-containing protein [Clostridium sp.]
MGMSMKGTPGTDSAAQNFANWFSTGNTCNTKNVSSTWRGADAFRNYWQSNAVGYKKFTSFTTDAYNYGYIGHAVSLLNSNGRAYHTLMVVGYSNGDLIYAAHSGSTKTGSLKSASSGGYGFILYKTY